MKEFLNKFMATNKNFEKYPEKELSDLFDKTIEFIYNAIGASAFRYKRGIHSAIFDSVMVATADLLKKKKNASKERYKEAYMSLIEEKEFKKYYTSATSDENSVERRIALAKIAFSSIS